VRELCAHGHQVLVQTGAGAAIGLGDDQYLAGRMAVQAGATHLEKSKGGRGVLLGGVPGVPTAHVVILGAGVVGTHALQVANMPGAVARTSTFALNNATIGHAVALADKGWQQALRDSPHLKNGLNVAHGQVTYDAVAGALGYAYVHPDTLLG
jgi:alanine dehydrogenase